MCLFPDVIISSNFPNEGARITSLWYSDIRYNLKKPET